MEAIKFRPLRVDKTGKIVVASYPQWNKVRCANYDEFQLQLVNEYEGMDKSAPVYNHKGEQLFHFNYNPWEVYTYKGSCLELDYDELRFQYTNFSIDNGDGWISYHWKGADCNGTPTFSHLDANGIANGYTDLDQFEPITVSYVLD